MASQNQHSHSTRKTRGLNHHNELDKGAALLKETFNEFKEKSDDIKALAKEYVQQKPMKSLGIALLTGVALALIAKR